MAGGWCAVSGRYRSEGGSRRPPLCADNATYLQLMLSRSLCRTIVPSLLITVCIVERLIKSGIGPCATSRDFIVDLVFEA